MKHDKTNSSPSNVKYTVFLTEVDLTAPKQSALTEFAKTVNVPGFRPGNAPTAIVEKQALENQNFQSVFLNHAIEKAYQEILKNENPRIFGRPRISIKKFVPFAELEIELDIDLMENFTMPNPKTLKVEPVKSEVSKVESDKVIENLRLRDAQYVETDAVAKNGDRVWIDFDGVDSTSKESIAGAAGKDYPLALGSNTFIPGFEENLVGQKKGDQKTFTLTFPKDYGMKALQNKKVDFTTTVNKVENTVLPEVNDLFAAQLGPFKTVEELKTAIESQLRIDNEQKNRREFTDKLIEAFVDAIKFEVPESLISSQVSRLMNESKTRASQTGMTWEDYLANYGKSEAEFIKTELTPVAERQIKTGMVLGEYANLNQIKLSDEEFKNELAILKSMYTDPKMLEEIEKPENQQDLFTRIHTGKVVEHIVQASGKLVASN